jgi:hypothetical protein
MEKLAMHEELAIGKAAWLLNSEMPPARQWMLSQIVMADSSSDARIKALSPNGIPQSIMPKPTC